MVKKTELTVEGLATLEEITRINFPRFVHPSDISSLFEYVAAKLGKKEGNSKHLGHCDLRYNVELNNRVHVLHDGFSSKESETAKISGSVTRLDPFGTATFDVTMTYLDVEELLGDNQGGSSNGGNVLTGIKFFTTPGYNLQELNPDELAVMKAFREQVNAYFVEHPKPSS